jgi:hypothetical protein
MGQVKSAYHDQVARQTEAEMGANERTNYAPISPSITIYLLMDCSVSVGAYMHRHMAEHDMDICIQCAEYEDQPDLHDYWVKSVPMSMATD